MARTSIQVLGDRWSANTSTSLNLGSKSSEADADPPKPANATSPGFAPAVDERPGAVL
jgi:hypothetical protein